jgi:lathosterol oxidase
MITGADFEPSLHAYVSYFVGFCIRYFAVGAALYWFFHVAFREKWLPYRIRYEIAWSMLNTACTGVATLFVYGLIHDGRTAMYFAVAEHGWAYFALSVLLCIAGYDTWIYWQHRWLHTPWLFRHVHSIHHRLANPTAFAAFAQHPIETFMGDLYFILFIVCVPIHPMAVAVAGVYMFGIGIIGHAGYEFYPRGFTRHWLLGWHNTSTHHNMHHRYVRCNYGNWFNYWDRLMGTNHPAYHDTFDAIKARVQASRTGAPALAARRAA